MFKILTSTSHIKHCSLMRDINEAKLFYEAFLRNNSPSSVTIMKGNTKYHIHNN